MDKVVALKEYSVAEDIQDFIDGLETINTKKKYSENIKKFIEWKWKVAPEFVTVEDINKLSYTDMKKFRDAMRRKYAAGSVNNIMTSVYSLLKELKRVQDENTQEYVYDIDDIERLKVRQLRNKNIKSAGYLEWDEVTSWIEWLEDSNESNKEKKIAFLELARTTGLRVSSLTNLKYKDIRKEDNVYVINSYLKGKKHKIPVSNEIGDMLLSLKRIGNTKDSKVFFSSKTAERLMDRLKDEFKVEEDRQISLHSLRNLAAWEVYCLTKDILQVQAILNHESIETTYGYLKDRQATESAPTLYVGKELNSEMVKNVDKEQFEEIFDALPRSIQYEIINKMNELGYSQE